MSELVARVGLVGLGNMGLPMAANLIRAGHTVYGVDLSRQARDRAVELGATATAQVADLAGQVDILILMLPDSGAVEAVLESAATSGVLSGDLLIVDMSSSEPGRTRALAARFATAGVRMIDAPVSGGVGGAEKATLTIMVGGDPDDIATAQPVLAAMGSVRPVGPLGAGHAIKALNNLLSATHLWITGEVMAVGERFGLEPSVMLQVFNGSSGRSGSTEKKWPDFVLPESYDSGFGLELMLKDMRIAVELGAEVGGFGRLGTDAVELWARAAEELPQGADHTEVAQWIKEKGDRGVG